MLCSVLFLSIYPLKIHKLFLLKFDVLGGISATLIYLRIKGTFNDMSYTKILFISSIISLTLPFDIIIFTPGVYETFVLITK